MLTCFNVNKRNPDCVLRKSTIYIVVTVCSNLSPFWSWYWIQNKIGKPKGKQPHAKPERLRLNCFSRLSHSSLELLPVSEHCFISLTFILQNEFSSFVYSLSNPMHFSHCATFEVIIPNYRKRMQNFVNERILFKGMKWIQPENSP